MLKADKIGLVALFTLAIVETIWLLWPRVSGAGSASDATMKPNDFSATDSTGAPIVGSTETPSGASRQILTQTTPEQKPRPSQTLGSTDMSSVQPINRTVVVF